MMSQYTFVTPTDARNCSNIADWSNRKWLLFKWTLGQETLKVMSLTYCGYGVNYALKHQHVHMCWWYLDMQTWSLWPVWNKRYPPKLFWKSQKYSGDHWTNDQSINVCQGQKSNSTINGGFGRLCRGTLHMSRLVRRTVSSHCRHHRVTSHLQPWPDLPLILPKAPTGWKMVVHQDTFSLEERKMYSEKTADSKC